MRATVLCILLSVSAYSAWTAPNQAEDAAKIISNILTEFSHDSSAKAVESTAQKLAQLGPNAEPTLLTLGRHSPNLRVREVAMRALAELKPPPAEAVRVATENLHNPQLRIQALDALNSMGPYAHGTLKLLLKSVSNPSLRPETRRHLIAAIGGISEGEPEALTAIVEASKSKDWQDYDGAVRALLNTADRIESALPALIEAWTNSPLLDMDHSVNAASPQLKSKLVRALIRRLEDPKSSANSATALCSLGPISIEPLLSSFSGTGAKTDFAVLTALDCISRRDRSSLITFSRAEIAAINDSGPLITAKLQEFLDNKNRELRARVAFILLRFIQGTSDLGKIIDNLDEINEEFGYQFNQAHLELKEHSVALGANSAALVRALQSQSHAKRLFAARCVSYLQNPGPSVIAALLSDLTSAREATNWDDYDAYSSALAHIGLPASKAILDLTMALKILDSDRSERARPTRAQIVSTLNQMYPESYASIAEVLNGSPTPASEEILDQLCGPRVNQQVINAVLQIVKNPKDWSRKRAIYALGRCGDDSATTLKHLGDAVRDEEDYLSISLASAVAITRISKGMAKNADYQHLSEFRYALGAMRSQLSSVIEYFGDPDDDGKSEKSDEDSESNSLSDPGDIAETDESIPRSTVDEYEVTMRQLIYEADQSEIIIARARFTHWLLVILLVILLVALPLLTFVLVDRWRRWLLVVLGRRWIFVIGQPNHWVDVSSSAGTFLIHCKSLEADSRELRINLPQIPNPETDGFREFQQRFRPRDCLRVSADSGCFAFPWSKYIGGDWSVGEESIIAGQIAAMDTPFTSRNELRNRSVAFSALGCSRSDGFPELTNIEAELKTVMKCWNRWGAKPNVVNYARREDFLSALRCSDLVHVAAHASLRGVALADGLVDGSDITDEDLRNIRCRLLAFSACRIGLIDQKESLVLKLVGSGVNVLGSTEEIDSAVICAFMEELYNAFLPSRRAQNVQLAEAIRTSTLRCKQRFERIRYNDWPRNINSLILYGDPTVRLVLR